MRDGAATARHAPGVGGASRGKGLAGGTLQGSRNHDPERVGHTRRPRHDVWPLLHRGVIGFNREAFINTVGTVAWLFLASKMQG